jgi:activating signal cointegrator complex subunit 2
MSLPPIAPFPEAAWREHIVPVEWEACLDAWILLAEAHLSLGKIDFMRISARDDSLQAFLSSYMSEAARTTDIGSFWEVLKWKRLRKLCFLLASHLLILDRPPDRFMNWEFLSDFGKVYGKTYSFRLVASLWTGPHEALQNSLAEAKTYLIKELDRGINSEQVELERRLKRLNHLFHCSPETATFFMNGSDFLDGLISCYKVMDPPLRKAIISTAYLCLIGLTEGPNPKTSLLTDQLYSLNAVVDTHKAGYTNVNDSLVAELVTVTPILQQILHRVENTGPGFGRLKPVIAALEAFRKPGGRKRKNFVKRKVDKGKAVAVNNDEYSHNTSKEVHVHRTSLISQVQDLFPDLEARFVMKLLDEYEDDVEQGISHLLEGSLPVHLKEGDRLEVL